MLEPLNETERGILEYLIGYLKANTYQPSLREIGKRFGLKSTKTTSEYLQALQDKGWIERDPSRSRGIRILGLVLETDAVIIPPLAEDGSLAADLRETLNETKPPITLDRQLIGSTRAAYLTMPDDSLAIHGIHAGDLLLVEPVEAEDLRPGDVVVTPLDENPYIHIWEEPPLILGPPVARVSAVVRRLHDQVPSKSTEDLVPELHVTHI